MNERPPDYVPDSKRANEQRIEARERLKEKLTPILSELLRSRRARGITVDEVRHLAEGRRWLTGEEAGRYLSFLSGFFKSLGAVPQGFHTTDHPKSNGRKVRVWVLAEYAVAVGEGAWPEDQPFTQLGAVAELVDGLEHLVRTDPVAAMVAPEVRALISAFRARVARNVAGGPEHPLHPPAPSTPPKPREVG